MPARLTRAPPPSPGDLPARPTRAQPPSQGDCQHQLTMEESFSSYLQPSILPGIIQYLLNCLRDEPVRLADDNRIFALFREEYYYGNKESSDLQIFFQTRCSKDPEMVATFILQLVLKGRFDVAACVFALFYISRLGQSTHTFMHIDIWRPVFVTALLLADKFVTDQPIRNSDLAKLFPVLSCSELMELECRFSLSIDFNLGVPENNFRSFCAELRKLPIQETVIRVVQDSNFVDLYEDERKKLPQQSSVISPRCNAGRFANRPSQFASFDKSNEEISGLRKLCAKLQLEKSKALTRAHDLDTRRAELEHDLDEALARARDLKQQRRNDADSLLCIICCDVRKDVAFSPCGHVCVCRTCARRLPKRSNGVSAEMMIVCPICRGLVEKSFVVHI